MISVFVSALEPSADILVCEIIKGLKKNICASNACQEKKEIKFFGMGGALSEKEGNFTSFMPLHHVAHMGLGRVIRNMGKFRQLSALCYKNILLYQPDYIVTVDSPGFHMFLGRKIRKWRAAGMLPMSVRHVHCVAPSVWAWKYVFGYKLSASLDKLLTIFPFEKKYIEKYFPQLSCVYVGHPLGDRRFLEEKNIKSLDARYICFCPGSRLHEIQSFFPMFLRVMKYVLLKESSFRGVIIMPPCEEVCKVIHQYISDYFKKSERNFILCVTDTAEKREIFSKTAAALTVSGTMTLELACHGVPMVVCYKVNKLFGYVLRSLLRLRYISIVNILAVELGMTPVVPEVVQENFSFDVLCDKILDIINNKENALKQRNVFHQIFQYLYTGSSFSENAAHAIMHAPKECLEGHPLYNIEKKS